MAAEYILNALLREAINDGDLNHDDDDEDEDEEENDGKEEEKKERGTVDRSQYTSEDLKFIDQNNLVCSICQNVIRGTVACTPCLHRFCDTCIFHHITSSHQNHQLPKCPNCKSPIHAKEEIFFHEALTKRLDDCMVSCLYYNPIAEQHQGLSCNERVPRAQYLSHVENCLFKPIQCPHCQRYMCSKYESSHVQECEKRLIVCESCGEQVPWVFLSHHSKNQCLNQIISCPNQGCTTMFPRSQSLPHRAICPYRVISCPFKCGANYSSIHQDSHAMDCSKRMVLCPHCSMSIPYDECPAHIAKTCSCAREVCPRCRQVMKRMDTISHVCPLQLIHCPKCSLDVARNGMDQHTKHECTRRLITCPKCHSTMMAFQGIGHLKTCPEEISECEGCKSPISNREMNFHRCQCPEVMVACKYSYAGCTEWFPRKSRESHMATHKDLHLEYLDRFHTEQWDDVS